MHASALRWPRVSPAANTVSIFRCPVFHQLPRLTTVLRQLGGAWGGCRVDWYERAVARAKIARQDEPPSQPPPESDLDQRSPPRRRYQFGIRQLLWIGVWLSLLLTVIRLSGASYEFVLPLLIGWLALQAVTIWLGGMLVRRIGRWLTHRQIRST